MGTAPEASWKPPSFVGNSFDSGPCTGADGLRCGSLYTAGVCHFVSERTQKFFGYL